MLVILTISIGFKKSKFHKSKNCKTIFLFSSLLFLKKISQSKLFFYTLVIKNREFMKQLSCSPNQGLLNRWTSQPDFGCTTGGLERVVSVHNST